MKLVVVSAFAVLLNIHIPSSKAAMVAQPDIGKIVTFIFLADENGNMKLDAQTKNPIPYGTGFFVFVKNENGGDGGHGYLVTDKHVLKDEKGNDFKKIFVRLDKLNGDAEFDGLDLVQNGKTIVYTHPDSTVDIAVIPVIPRPDVIDFKTIPVEWLAERALPGIGEGSDVFFVGLFTTFYGEHKNRPIFRFGRMAMIPDGRLPWQDRPDTSSILAELYLIETQTYGGNSGSPVFFSPGLISYGPQPSSEKLIGIIRGYYGEWSPIGVINAPTGQIPVSKQNIGIAAVTPAYLLHDILFSDALKKLRSDTPITPPSPDEKK